MYYRPQEKKRHPALTLVLLVLLAAMGLVLAALGGIYVGYLEWEVPTLAERFGPTPTPTRPAVLYVADGDGYFAEGKLNQAVAAYERAIEIDPTDDIPYIRQSRLLIYTGDTAKALARAEEAVLLNPTSPENLAYYCRALDWEAQYAAAFDACSCAIELDPAYAPGYAFLAEVHADQGEWFAARSVAEQAIETDFQSVDAHHNMGYVMEIQGRYDRAVDFYENAITLAPNLAPLYVAAGRSYYWLGNFEQAADYFKKAIKLNPFHPEAYDRLGWTYQTTGEQTRAIDALEQSVGIDPTYAKGWGHLALVYYTRQNFETAIELMPQAIDLAETKFLRQARQVEIHTEVQTLTGPEYVPVLQGRFLIPNSPDETSYVAQLSPVTYQPPPSPLDTDQPAEESTCAASIVRAIRNQAPLPRTLQPESVGFTQAFTQTRGTATLNLSTGNMFLDVSNMPQPQRSPYQITVSFWPNRVDDVGYVQPDGDQRIQVNVEFEESPSAPIEYYYTLGLAYAYMDPPMCEQAVPHLLTALEKDSGGLNPAWAGLRICPSAGSPPTPVPTFTPTPELGQ